MGSSFKTKFDMKDTRNNLTERLREFLENEARSCSMDFGCVTPEYVYRMWGGAVALSDIVVALKVCKRELLYEH